MTELLMVNPSAKVENYGALSPFSALEPPLWCALKAAYARNFGADVAILDAEVEGLGAVQTAERIAAVNPKLADITVMGINPSVSSTPKMSAVREIIAHLRKLNPSIRIALSGLHPSALPERTMAEEKPDYVIIGEGITALPWLATHNEARSFINTMKLVDVNELPMPAWDLLPMEKYRCHTWHALENIENRSPYTVTYTSMGCPYLCSYCNVKALYNNQNILRYRHPSKIAEELDILAKKYHVHHVKFYDEMFALSSRHVISTCEKIAALGHNFNIWAYARVDSCTRHMLEAMKGAGVNWVCIGFESASETSRLSVSKRYGQDKIDRVVQMCRDAKINIIANLMVGLPDDDENSMQETLHMAEAYNFEYVNIYAAGAYPGSQLYDEAVVKGVRLPEKWADYSQFSPDFIPLPTRHLTSRQVLEFRDYAFRQYFDREKYLRMIQEKFGLKARSYIEDMLKVKVVRNLAALK